MVHGGLSPELPNVKAINKINRFQDPPPPISGSRFRVTGFRPASVRYLLAAE